MSVTRRIHQDFSDKTTTFEIRQDAEPILEENKRWRNGPRQTGDFRRVASIPVTILTAWLYEEHKRGNAQLTMGSPEFDALVARKLRDPDWQYLRTG